MVNIYPLVRKCLPSPSPALEFTAKSRASKTLDWNPPPKGIGFPARWFTFWLSSFRSVLKGGVFRRTCRSRAFCLWKTLATWRIGYELLQTLSGRGYVLRKVSFRTLMESGAEMVEFILGTRGFGNRFFCGSHTISGLAESNENEISYHLCFDENKTWTIPNPDLTHWKGQMFQESF